MPERRPRRPRRPHDLPLLAAATLAAALGSAFLAPPAQAQPAETTVAAAATSPVIVNSGLDQRLFYQLLVGEMALGAGDPGGAYELILDAARRTRDEGLFRRAVNIAMQARAGEQALTATHAWRTAHGESADALRTQLQILLLLNRPDALAEPMQALLAQTPAAELNGVIAALPRFLQRAGDPRRVAALMEEALQPYRDRPESAVPVRVALGRAWFEAKEADRALALAREAHALDRGKPGPALLALELMRDRPEAETLVLDHLRQPGAEAAMRMAYVRVLTVAQRYADAVAQLQLQTAAQPDVAPPYLQLGALQLELKRTQEGEAALLRYIELTQREQRPAPSADTAAVDTSTTVGDSDGEETPDESAEAAVSRPEEGLMHAWLMLAQSAEQRGDYPAVERWLSKVDDPRRALEVQSRRASILARQGKVAQARELIRRVPERRTEDGRAKLVAEAGLLRDARQWRDAYDVLARATERHPDDADLLYEQAMMAEKTERLDEMERLLRRVIALKPDNAQAHNALGYSLADRRVRLSEARQLIQHALELAPGDPFITDSLGWVEFRLGNHDEAATLLRRAYDKRADTEIAAHLGEVLWAMGQRDEARKVWRQARVRDAGNDVLRETLARLRVDL